MNMVIGFDEQTPAEVSFRGERVNHKNTLGVLVVAVVVALGALGLWFYEHSQLQAARTRVAADRDTAERGPGNLKRTAGGAVHGEGLWDLGILPCEDSARRRAEACGHEAEARQPRGEQHGDRDVDQGVRAEREDARVCGGGG
jgi:hypothetical protein